MRMLHFMLAIVAFLSAPIVATFDFVVAALASTFPPTRGHFHLMPSSPRSIRDTMRMGLA